MGFLLKLQTLCDEPETRRDVPIGSIYSLTFCLSTASAAIC